MAARVHHRLVFIHPFENGNGRFSRLIADRFLLAFKCPHPVWPSHLNQEGVVRKGEIKTLKSADTDDYQKEQSNNRLQEWAMKSILGYIVNKKPYIL